MKETQESKILAHLQSGRSITPLDALSLYNCFRLGGRIYDLKKRGFIIKTEMVETSNGAKVASYKLLPSIKEMSGSIHYGQIDYNDL